MRDHLHERETLKPPLGRHVPFQSARGNAGRADRPLDQRYQSPLLIILSATAIECCVLSAALALCAVFGRGNAWLDLINAGAPLVIAMGAIGAAAAQLSLHPSRFRRICVGMGVSAGFYGIWTLSPEISMPWAARTPDGPSLRVVSANAYRSNLTPLRAVQALVQQGGDVLLLQEIDSVAFVPRSREILDRAFPFFTDCPGSDLQIRTRRPILAQGCRVPSPVGPRANSDIELVWARVQGLGPGTMVVASTHLARPLPVGRQSQERAALSRALGQFGIGGPVILGGDFNTPAPSFAMRDQDRQLRPLRRWTHGLATYPARLNVTGRSWPLPLVAIDHLYASPTLVARSVTRLRVPGSDHLALVADLEPAR